MIYNWYKNKKLTEQRVRQIVTSGLPEIILPEHVIDFGIIPFINTPEPTTTNLQLANDDGIEVTETEATQKWIIVDKFKTESEETAFTAQLLIDLRDVLQTINKQSCTSFILNLYPENIQRSAALGVYPSGTVSSITDHIARCIAEENRVFDLIEASNDPNTIETPVWPEA